MTHAVLLCYLQRLLPSCVHHMLVLDLLAASSFYLPFPLYWLCKFDAEERLEVLVLSSCQLIDLIKARLNVHDCCVRRGEHNGTVLTGNARLPLSRLLDGYHIQLDSVSQSLLIQELKMLRLLSLRLLALTLRHHHKFTRSLDRHLMFIAKVAPRFVT